MKNNDNHDIWVGAIVVAVVAVVFALSYSGKQLASQASVGNFPVIAVFNRVDGLFEGDEVRLGGIAIGSVGKQVLDKNFRAVVILNIKNGIPIPIDSAAAIHTDGLFGSKFVVLEPGVEDAMMKAGDTLESTQGAVVVSELLGLIIDQGRARQMKQAQQAQQRLQQGNK